jgi:hypothetical protein
MKSPAVNGGAFYLHGKIADIHTEYNERYPDRFHLKYLALKRDEAEGRQTP